jgi:sulfur transfer protein SufE
VYQERKAQITAHNKKYERQVRGCLEKFNLLEEQWLYVVETVEREFANHQSQQDKLRGQLPSGKNLAELQGVSRREKDACQTFEEKCREFQDKLHDIAIT